MRSVSILSAKPVQAVSLQQASSSTVIAFDRPGGYGEEWKEILASQLNDDAMSFDGGGGTGRGRATFLGGTAFYGLALSVSRLHYWRAHALCRHADNSTCPGASRARVPPSLNSNRSPVSLERRPLETLEHPTSSQRLVVFHYPWHLPGGIRPRQAEPCGAGLVQCLSPYRLQPPLSAK